MISRTVDQFLLDVVVRLLDVIVLALAAQWASHLRFDAPLSDLEPIYTLLPYTGCILMFVGVQDFHLHTPFRGRSSVSIVGRLAFAWGLVLTGGLIISFFLKEAGDPSRLWIIYWFSIGLILLSCVHLAIYYSLRFLRKSKRIGVKRVVIVGYGRTGREMHRRALAQDWFGYEVSAVYDESLPDLSGVRCLNRMEDIATHIEDNRIDEVWITLALNEAEKTQRLHWLLRKTLVDLRYVPDAYSMEIFGSRVAEFLGFPAIDINCPHRYGLQSVAKALLDRVLALIALILLAPLFVVIAICIKCSSRGPVMYKQARHGLNGRPFMIYKFRSMKLHAEVASGVVTQATKGDPRITKIGAFIRRTSIDELPQFINVLKGEMSIVGPRPHAVEHNEAYKDRIEDYMLRHRVKPGITGWAQIHGYRGETDTVEKMEKRVQFDMQYIRDWCLWLDMKIIVWTAFKGWTGNNAY